MQNPIDFVEEIIGERAKRVQDLLDKLNMIVRVGDSLPSLCVGIVDSRSFNTFAYVTGVENVKEYDVAVRDDSIQRQDWGDGIVLIKKINRKKQGARYYRLELVTSETIHELRAIRYRQSRLR